MQLWMVCSLVVLAVYFILICVMKAMSKNRLLLEQRLAAYSLQEKVESVIREELSRPLTERLLRPLLQKVSALPARMLPGAALEGLSRKLVMAGNPGHLSPQEFAVLKLSLAVLLPGALYIFGLLFMPTSVRGMVLVGMAVLGYFSPEIFLKLKRRARQEEIRNMLPEVLDLLMVSVEAGLGFDAAMAKVVEKMDGVLPQELGRLLKRSKWENPARKQ